MRQAEFNTLLRWTRSNLTYVSPGRLFFVMAVRGRCTLRRGECLEKLNDIDGAVALYRQVANDWSGKAEIDR